MSDQQEQTTEKASAAPEKAAEEKKTEQRPAGFDKAKAEKFGYIDFDSLGDEVKKVVEPRFKRLYSDFKTGERAIKELRDINTALLSRLDRIESTSTNERISAHVANLRSAIKQAGEEGDWAKVAELTDKLTDWKVKLASGAAAKQPPKEQTPKQEPSADQSSGRELTGSERKAVQGWIEETNDDGDVVRPWAQSGHRQNAKAVKELEAVLADDDYQDADVKDILAEVDRRMTKGEPKQRSAAAVLDSDGGPARGGKGRAVALSDEEKRVAERMYGGKPQEAHEKYRRAKAAVKGT